MTRFFVALIVITAAIVGALLVLHQPSTLTSLRSVNEASSTASTTASSTTNTMAAERAVPPGTTLFENAQYHFSLFYPTELAVTEYPEQGGGRSFSFENKDESQGFEIYAFPYSDTQITQKRFLTDEPSGVRQQPNDVVIDGVKATMFFGNNAIMGDTREVWFIKNGYLYELTTYKSLDSWLGSIMQTWKFI